MLRSATFTRRLAATSLPKCTAISTIQRTPTFIIPTQHSTFPVTNLSHLINTRSLSSSSRNLGSILEREITEETEAGAGSNELPEELDTLYNDISKNWTIVQGLTGIGTDETGGGATVGLYKKENGSNGAKIGIVFHCQDTEEDNAFSEDMFNEEREETEEEPATAVRFAVTVSKGGKTVVMQCRAAEEDLIVESAAVRDGDAEAALIALAGGEQLHSSLYQVR